MLAKMYGIVNGLAKIHKRVSLDSGHHVKSNISNFPMSAIFGIGILNFVVKCYI